MKGLRWQDFSGAHLHYRTFTVPRTVWPIPSIVGGGGGGGVKFSSMATSDNLKKLGFVKGIV